jgi:heme oxygenase (mycobilin-producing)
MAITLVNLFNHVPEDKLDEFEARWEQVSKQMQVQPGFIAFHFYRAIRPNQEYQYVNVAQWESQEHLERALATVNPAGPFQEAGWEVQNYPNLFDLALES